MVRYGPGANECPRDKVPLVAIGELERVRTRVCSECGAEAADPAAEFCGRDGARVVARWEIDLVAPTAVPGVAPGETGEPGDTFHDADPLPFHDSASEPTTKPERPAAVTPESPVEAPAPRAPSPRSGGPTSSGVSASWFLEGKSAQTGLEDVDAPPIIPTRVSRTLVFVTVISGVVFAGALGFALYARSAARASEAPAGGTDPKAATEVAGPAVALPGQETAAAPPSVTPQALAAQAVAAAPPPPPPLAPQPPPPPPEPAALSAIPEAPAAAKPPAQESKPKKKTAPKRRPKERKAAREAEDPAAALDQALRKAASEREASPAPAPQPPPPSPPSPAPAPASERLSRTEANRYFREASDLYQSGKPQEALRRFRIIEQLGPRDADLQGRVLLNMAYIYQRSRECAAARRYYERAQKVLPAGSAMRAKAEAGLRDTEAGCQ
jgi:outer membrane biosynthesis protein TonB